MPRSEGSPRLTQEILRFAHAKRDGNQNAFLNPRGYHVQYAPRLLRKLFAVRSGPRVYGRNNICYVEGIDPSSHHTLYGCSRCQTVCPINKKYLSIIVEPAEFTLDSKSRSKVLRCATLHIERQPCAHHLVPICRVPGTRSARG